MTNAAAPDPAAQQLLQRLLASDPEQLRAFLDYLEGIKPGLVAGAATLTGAGTLTVGGRAPSAPAAQLTSTSTLSDGGRLVAQPAELSGSGQLGLTGQAHLEVVRPILLGGGTAVGESAEPIEVSAETLWERIAPQNPQDMVAYITALMPLIRLLLGLLVAGVSGHFVQGVLEQALSDVQSAQEVSEQPPAPDPPPPAPPAAPQR